MVCYDIIIASIVSGIFFAITIGFWLITHQRYKNSDLNVFINEPKYQELHLRAKKRDRHVLLLCLIMNFACIVMMITTTLECFTS